MKNERKIIIDETTDRDSLISYINVFMQVMLLARLQSAEKNSRKFASVLNMTEEDFIFRKNSEIEKFNKLFGLKQKSYEITEEKEETNIAYITTEEYKANERKFYSIEGETPEEEFVFYIGSIIACLDSILLKKEEYDDELEREAFIKAAKELYSDKTTLAFIVEFEIQDKIDEAINDSPQQVLKLYYQIQMALNKRKLIYDPKSTVTNVVSFLFDEDNFQYQEEIKQHIPLLLDLINLGISSYLEKTKNNGKWMDFLSTSTKNEKEAALLISNMLSDETQALETKLVAICGILAYHNKFSTLRETIIEELKLYVAQKAYRLPEVLMSQLIKVYGLEEAAINKKIKDTPIFTLLKEDRENRNMTSSRNNFI